ncbi:MAG: ribosome small subunit-dependent GTPase A, partial [Nannocystaceae bacterium]
DWLLYEPNKRGGMSTVHHLLNRRTQLVRQTSGRRPGPQVMAANIDRVAVVTTPGTDFNLRRLERYLQAIDDGGAQAAIIVNKVDRCDDLPKLLEQLDELKLSDVPVACVSAKHHRGAQQLAPLFAPTQTIALVGSSGVGKSTLINWWLGSERQEVGEVREGDQKGRHTTTHRELFLLPPRQLEVPTDEPSVAVSGLLIDTPGIRELQLYGDQAANHDVFSDILNFARRCKFRDCSHRHEPRCAVRAAVEAGKLPHGRLASFHKLTQLNRHRP